MRHSLCQLEDAKLHASRMEREHDVHDAHDVVRGVGRRRDRAGTADALQMCVGTYHCDKQNRRVNLAPARCKGAASRPIERPRIAADLRLPASGGDLGFRTIGRQQGDSCPQKPGRVGSARPNRQWCCLCTSGGLQHRTSPLDAEERRHGIDPHLHTTASDGTCTPESEMLARQRHNRKERVAEIAERLSALGAPIDIAPHRRARADAVARPAARRNSPVYMKPRAPESAIERLVWHLCTRLEQGHYHGRPSHDIA